MYADYVEGFREHFPATSQWFEEMRTEESGHRRRLIELYRERFGDHIPLIRRHDVKGFVPRSSVWLTSPLRVDAARTAVEGMELEVRRFYERAATRVTDAKIRQLLSDSALEERKHAETAESLDRELRPEGVRTRRTKPSASCSCCKSCNPRSPG